MTGVILGSGDVVYDDGVLRIARIEPPRIGLVLAGEADETGYKPLVAALAVAVQLASASADGGGPAEVHLELSGLEFCDAAALHAMIAPAGDGGRIVLHNAAATLRALIRIAGWDELPGLVVVAGQ